MPKNKGFTLVELLVVISIIAIITVIGMTVYGDVQKRARDARRKADINAIADAMEANYVRGSYSAMTGSFFASNVIPADPRNGNATGCQNAPCKYCVLSEGGPCAADSPAVTSSSLSAGVTSFVICANLEKDSPAYYCLSNQQ